MFKQVVPKAKKCQNCGKNNPLLYKKCTKCQKSFINIQKQHQQTNPHASFFRRFSLADQISKNQHLAESAISVLSEQVLSYADKFRTLFLVLDMVQTECVLCTDFLNLLIQTGKEHEEGNPIDEQLDIISQRLVELDPHLIEYEGQNYPNANHDIYTLQSLRFRLRINRNHPHPHQLDLEDGELEDEWANDEWEEGPLDIYADWNLNQPASSEQLNLIKTISPDDVPAKDLCPICLEKLKDNNDDVIVKLPCNHLYHNSCIREWLKISNKCPYGRCQIK